MAENKLPTATAAKFSPGTMVITPGALHRLTQDEVVRALQRHLSGDWGEVDEHDRRENELALQSGLRLFSVYRTVSGETFWVITEADRSATTLLMPDEY